MNILAFVLAASAGVVVVALALDFIPEIVAEAKVKDEETDWVPWASDVKYYTSFDASYDMSRHARVLRELSDKKVTVRRGAHRRV